MEKLRARIDEFSRPFNAIISIHCWFIAMLPKFAKNRLLLNEGASLSETTVPNEFSEAVECDKALINYFLFFNHS
jgi:hypothetical protein